MSVEEIKAKVVSGWRGVPAVRLCLLLIDHLSSAPADELNMLTFRELAHIVGTRDPENDLIVAISILRSLSVLDARALLVDFDQQEYEIEASELAEAHQTGELVHPGTGNVISNYEDKVIPFFTPTPSFIREAHGG